MSSSDQHLRVSPGNIAENLAGLWQRYPEIQALGIFGSLARPGDFRPRSDIDIFVIVGPLCDGDHPDIEGLWLKRIKPLLASYHRDMTVIVYPIDVLEDIPNWYVFDLAADHIILYDRGRVAPLFEAILAKADEIGMAQQKVGHRKRWMPTRPRRWGERIRVSLKR